jgi:3-hydroxyisobutyryl-CoA hydrolase
VQGKLSGDFVKGVTAKLVDKPPTTADWQPSWTDVVNADAAGQMPMQSQMQLVDDLFDSRKRPRPVSGFDIKKMTTMRPRHASFGLPNEEDVERALSKRTGGQGEMGWGQLIEELEMELKGKHGVRERVEEIVARKARLVDGKAVWIRI